MGRMAKIKIKIPTAFEDGGEDGTNKGRRHTSSILYQSVEVRVYPVLQDKNDLEGSSEVTRAVSCASKSEAVISDSTGKMAVTWSLGNMTLALQASRGRTSPSGSLKNRTLNQRGFFLSLKS